MNENLLSSMKKILNLYNWIFFEVPWKVGLWLVLGLDKGSKITMSNIE